MSVGPAKIRSAAEVWARIDVMLEVMVQSVCEDVSRQQTHDPTKIEWRVFLRDAQLLTNARIRQRFDTLLDKSLPDGISVDRTIFNSNGVLEVAFFTEDVEVSDSE